MKRILILIPLLFAILLLAGCEGQPPSAPESPQQQAAPLTVSPLGIARSLAQQAGWPLDEVAIAGLAPDAPLKNSSGGEQIMNFLGQPLGDGVVHYKFQIRVGPGPYDVIRIHRVTKEPTLGKRKKTENVFLIHGDYKDFEGCFLPGVVSQRRSDDFGFAVYMAKNDVDVWGIDHAWTLVPASVTGFGFMANWGMQRMVDELSIAVAVARITRQITGNGFSAMLLSGYSAGSTTGFALLNQETCLPPVLRNVSGFIPVDQGVATNVPEWEAAMCAAVENYRNLMSAGQYQDNNPLVAFGTPAVQDPSGPSVLIPGFTNLQAGLALGVFPFFSDVSSHFLAGTFDTDGVPTGLQYSNVDDWLDFMVSAPPYEPLAFERDEYITNCPQAGDVPWDDHLDDIRVPILYVMAGGGFGYTGEYTLSLLGSSDITRLRVSLHPPSEAALDFAHIDLFLANNAQQLVWRPILTWIRSHS